MSSRLRVACPHCLARLKLKSRGMLGRRVTCPKCRETFDAVEEDEEPFGPAELTRFARAITADDLAENPRRMKRSNGVPAGLGWFVAGSALTAIAVAAFFVPWSSLVADINLNPFADTPDTIMAQETPLLSELADLMEGVADGAPFRKLPPRSKTSTAAWSIFTCEPCGSVLSHVARTAQLVCRKTQGRSGGL